LLSLPCWRGVLVINYHRIGDLSDSELNRSVWSATADGLDRQLKLFKRHFELVGADAIDQRLLRRPGRRVMVTFDDGYRDLYEVAFPVLQANDVRATMFICSGFVDGVATAWWDEIAWMIRRFGAAELAPGPWSSRALPLAPGAVDATIDAVTRAYWLLPVVDTGPFLERLGAVTGGDRRPAHDDWITWEMAREMSAAGHELGAHTVTHPILARLPASDQREEIATSVARIEAEVGSRPRSFAYPVGTTDAFDAVTVDAVRAAGVKFAFSNYGGRVTAGFQPFDIRRLSSESLRDESLLRATLALPRAFIR
jgi:peptidoglycan/xylan/chitin deacetylase (PgdA/CDA1 family)